MTGRNALRRTAAGLLLAVSALTACAGDADEAPDAPDAATPSDGGEDTAGDTAQDSARDVVAAWVTAIIEERPEDACLLMASSPDDGAEPETGTPELCADGGPMGAELTGLAESFTPADTRGTPTVTVTGDPGSGGTAEFPIEAIDVGGQSLQDVVLSHSEGVDADSLDMTVEAATIGDLWYVTDLGISFG